MSTNQNPEDLTTTVQKLLTPLQKLQQEITQINQDLSLINQNQKTLETQIQEKTDTINLVNQEKSDKMQVIQKLSSDYAQSQSQVQNFQSIIASIQAQLDSLDQQNNSKTKPKQNDTYDYSMGFNNIFKVFKKGIRIQKQQKSKLNMFKNVVSILGAANSGKTKIINELTKMNYQSGYNNQTLGINFAIFKSGSDGSNKIVFLDTLGEQEVAQIYDLKTLESKIKELQNQQQKDGITDNEFDNIDKELKKLKLEKNNKRLELKSKEKDLIKQSFITENLLREYAKSLSNINIYCINEFNSFQQKEIQKIQQLNKIRNQQKGQKSFLYIIHNYKNLGSISDIQFRIQKDIKNTTGNDLQKQLKDGIEVQYIDQENYTIHFIMGQEGKESGDFFNQYTYDQLKQISQQTSIKVLEENQLDMTFEDHFLQYLNSNFSKYITLSNPSIDDKKDLFQMKSKYSKKTQKNENYICLSDYYSKSSVQSKQIKVIDDIQIFENEEELKLKYVINIVKDKFVELALQFPNYDENDKSLFKYRILDNNNETFTQIQIKGQIIPPQTMGILNQENQQKHLNSIKFAKDRSIQYGKFDQVINLCKTNVKLILNSQNQTYKDGILKLQFYIQTNSNGQDINADEW